MGCCIAAAASAASSAAAMDASSYHVTPNNAPRRRVEKRRRLEQDYYRQLASQQKQQRQPENLGEADVASSHLDNHSRQLGASAAGIHKKGQEYAPIGVHQKGNKDDEDEDQQMKFMPMGSQSAATTTSTTSAAGTDAPPAPAQSNNGDDGDDNSKPENLSLATNLRSFTRIGGQGYALPDEKRYPYMASLQLEGHASGGTYDIHMCGGILVAPDLIMTAAHCAHYSPEGDNNKYQAFNGIEIGKADLTDEGATFDPYSLQTYKLYYENLVPDKLHMHPNFNEDTYEHDVMLVKVFGKSRFPPVKIGRGDIDTSDSLTVLGWGADSANSGQKYSNQLKSAHMKVMPNERCRGTNVEVKDPQTQATSRMSLKEHVFDDMMCATSNDRYICYGDAGGPAIAQGANSDEDEVYGILSWGYGCVSSNYPAVMARISDHYDWIRKTICSTSSDPPEQYGCFPKRMTALSGVAKQTVTLKLKLDKMAVETGFVIEVRDTREIIAQRQTGYYKSEGNGIVLETMDLPKNQCYRLVMLDSYGDGNCCDMGGGSSILYSGTDVGYYTGQKLVEVNGNFEFDNGEEFCLTSPANSVQVVANPPPPSPPYVAPPSPPRTPRPTRQPVEPTPSNHLSVGSGSGGNGQTSGWSGPENNPAYEYCTQFCNSSSNGMMCGNHACVVHIPDVATDDSQEEPEQIAFAGPLVSNEFYVDSSEYYLTVQIQFDDKPEEVSWVLYDLTLNEVKVFVDFGEYPKEEFANKLLNIGVTMDGPEEGEKQYAFTVYDKGSDGLCCDHGEGYYKVFLGDVEDDLKLLEDEEFEFSSSFYFTLFEMEGLDAELETHSPTSKPTKRPTRRPTKQPTQFPTKYPTVSPTTERPTEPWEKRRPEDMSAIGARWNMRTKTAPGVFNDVGGDQHQYKFNVDGSIRNAVPRDSLARGIVVCSFALAIMH